MSFTSDKAGSLKHMPCAQILLQSSLEFLKLFEFRPLQREARV